MTRINDVIVKRVSMGISGIIDIEINSENIYDSIEHILQNKYFNFDPSNEFITVNHKILKNIKNSDITEKILRSGLEIYSNTAKYLFNTVCKVPSQYDEFFNETSNQCSWISLEFIKNRQKLIDTIKINDIDELKNIYTKCMIVGSDLRKQNGKLIQGENIDDLINNSQIKSTIYGNSTLLTILDKSVIDMIVKPKITMLSNSLFISDIKELENEQMIIINRDGQTFVFLKLCEQYYIFDSHIRNIYCYDYEDLINYILENNQDGFFYILWSKY